MVEQEGRIKRTLRYCWAYLAKSIGIDALDIAIANKSPKGTLPRHTRTGVILGIYIATADSQGATGLFGTSLCPTSDYVVVMVVLVLGARSFFVL